MSPVAGQFSVLLVVGRVHRRPIRSGGKAWGFNCLHPRTQFDSPYLVLVLFWPGCSPMAWWHASVRLREQPLDRSHVARSPQPFPDSIVTIACTKVSHWYFFVTCTIPRVQRLIGTLAPPRKSTVIVFRFDSTPLGFPLPSASVRWFATSYWPDERADPILGRPVWPSGASQSHVVARGDAGDPPLQRQHILGCLMQNVSL
jgi:hypothetical protein